MAQAQASNRVFMTASVVAVLATVAFAWDFYNRRASQTDKMSELRVAMGTVLYRTVEPRLSGGFAFRPYRLVAEASYKRALGRAAESVPKATTRETRLEDLHANAVIQLLAGHLDVAVTLFERSLQLRSGESRATAINRATDPALIANYGAACYERAVRQSHPLDLTIALTAADRAIELNPNCPEPRHLRALVLESLYLRNDAIDAWRAYLLCEAGSEWAAEGRRHLANLERPAPVTAEPMKVRILAEDSFLGEWASATLRGDNSTARTALARAKAIGQSLAASGGDRTVAESVDLIEAASVTQSPVRINELAGAHAAYRAARLAFAKARDEKARKLMNAAADLLDRARSPLAFRARIYVATIDSYSGGNDDALESVQQTIDRIGDHSNDYPVAAGQAYWLRGLIQFALGMPYDALRSYEIAGGFLARSRETSNMSGAETGLAETYRYLGNADDAWIHQVRALRALEVGETYTRRQTATSNAAFAALDLGLPKLAELFTRRLALNAYAAHDPVFAAQAAVTRAQIQNALHRSNDALAAVSEAEKLLASIPPTSSTARLFADVAIFRAEATMATHPETAIASLDAAIDRLHALEHSSRLPRVYLLRGESELRRGDRAAAERSFEDGIDLLEQQRDHIASDLQRSTFTDTGRLLYDAAIRLLVDGRDTAAALRMVRRARAMSVTMPGYGWRNAGSLGEQRPRGEALIEYYLLPDALLTWISSGRATKFVEQRILLASIVSSIEAASDAIAAANDPAASRAQAVHAYDLLIRPVAGLLADDQQVLIAPDGFLHRVPFAALVDSQTNAPLIEHHAVTIALGSTLPKAGARYRSILVVAAPPVAGLEQLDNVVGEARSAAAAFSRALVLDGPSATPSRFLAEAVRFDVVHFAGHAVWNEREPQLAALRLAPDATSRDGALHAFEVGSHRFKRTGLVVLAACDTARGRVAGPGLLSFARTFVASGVPRVIGSLWPADDASSARLFAWFYDALMRGLEPAEALREAQKKTMELFGSAPRGWAAFQIYVGSSPARERLRSVRLSVSNEQRESRNEK
jgi:CHAT domain-containing protein/tetratricopeptide (TPR) repeat protein